MTELSKQILGQYQVRKTKKQKNAFIQLIQEHFPEAVVQTGRLPASRNLIIGDMEKARVIYGAHYDTCAQLPFPNFIAPKRPLLSICYSFLVMMPIILIIIALDFLLGYVNADFWVVYVINLLSLCGLLFLIIAGKANKHTANDNTSGVITVLEILQNLSPEQREHAVFVLFDNEEIGLMGSALFRKKFKKQVEEIPFFNFDCVSDGDYLLLAPTKDARKHLEAIQRAFQSTGNKQIVIENGEKIYYPSDQIGFTMGIAVAALKMSKRIGYYMDRIHTKRDVIFDEENITLLTNSAIEFINYLDEGTPK